MNEVMNNVVKWLNSRPSIGKLSIVVVIVWFLVPFIRAFALVLINAFRAYNEGSVTIVNGSAAGQTRKIMSINGTTLTLEGSFAPMPTPETMFVVSPPPPTVVSATQLPVPNDWTSFRRVTPVPVVKPTIVFCITCKGRLQHIARTLEQNIIDNADYSNAKFVVLDYNSQDGLIGYLDTEYTDVIKSGRLVVYSMTEDGPFKMAHAKNMAHRCGILEGADILVNLDADNFTHPGFATYIEEQFRMGNIFLWAKMVKDAEGRLPRGISGRIVVRREAFLKAGGYDEKYAVWGPDDKDFNARLWALAYWGIEIDPQYLDAILHNDKMRFREYKNALPMDEYDEPFTHVADAPSRLSPIANNGRFGCGVVYKNFDFSKPILLGPVPTRIFGIGMHKTGTTSLNAALGILKIDSAHWRNAHWAKSIWNDMRTIGRSPTLEQHYALSDLPIPMLYKELDKAYPGSKFILTTRNSASWIKSVRNHWSVYHNPFRRAWDTDPFTHKVHHALYGTKNFNMEVMLKRYWDHNNEVQMYFRGRPDDLLVLDMEKPSWPALCKFLGVPVPSVPYPWEFATGNQSFSGDGDGV